MDSKKAMLILGLMAIVLISSEVSARDLTETSTTTKEEVADKTKELNDAKFGGGQGYGHGYGHGGHFGGGGHHGGHFGGGGHHGGYYGGGGHHGGYYGGGGHHGGHGAASDNGN